MVKDADGIIEGSIVDLGEEGNGGDVTVCGRRRAGGDCGATLARCCSAVQRPAS